MKNSRFVVVAISKNYASSRWCLDELQLIMELEEEEKIETIPLFYGIDPSHVRHQRGNFDLEKYRTDDKLAKMIPKWRQALERIADHSGGVTLDCKDEATMIVEIAERISSRSLSLLPVDLKGHIFGLEDYMLGVRPLMENAPIDEVRMIGIHGVGSIGKTTIASFVYEKYKNQFSTHHCYIEDIGSCVKLPNGLLELQKRLVLEVIGQRNADLENKVKGARFIEERFKNLKVLLVLDNVDDGVQLHYLAREISWFGAGSRIIITTRDKRFLEHYGVTNLYAVKRLDDEKALQLFNEIAFQGKHEHSPSRHLYDPLSTGISRHAQGLPSILIEFGIRFRNTPLKQWEVALDSLNKAFRENRKSSLRASYDKLDEFGKSVFLHVACLFNGDHVARVESLFNRDNSWVKDLVEKSLICLSSDWLIDMSDLVKDMGKQIVRQRRGVEHNCANQRILWDRDDIYQVVVDKSGTSNTEGLAVDVGEMHGEMFDEMIGEMPNYIQIEWNVFTQMHNLIFLNISNNSPFNREDLILEKNICVPRRLRLLDWDAYPFTALPSMISPTSLVELNLCNSKLTTLWSGKPRILNLRKMDLTGSKDLKQLPNLEKAEYLEELILKGCSSLKTIPNAICSLPRLRKVDVSNCCGLRNLPITIRESETTVFQSGIVCIRSLKLALAGAEAPQWISLTNLWIRGELNIKFLKVFEGSAEHLCFVSEPYILLEHQTTDLILPPSPWKSLDIIRYCIRERSHFKCNSLSEFPWVMELNLVNLKIQKIPSDISQMVELEKVDLSGNNFKDLPKTMSDLMKLKHLTICNCRELKELPELYQVEKLILSDCTILKTVVTPFYQGTYSLVELWLDNYKSVNNLSDQLARFQNLTHLDISRQDFETVPASINILSSLATLCLDYCHNLTSVTDILHHVNTVNAHGCNSLQNPSYTCLHPTQNPSQITRFPVGQHGEEAPMCGCPGKIVITNEGILLSRKIHLAWIQILAVWEHVSSWFWCFLIGTVVVGLRSIIRITGMERFTTSTATTTTTFHIYLCTFLFAILLHYKR